MDLKRKKSIPNPELSANALSKFLFLWVTPLLFKGAKKDLTIDDIYDELPEDNSSLLGTQLERIWENECKHSNNPSFLKTMLRFFGPKYLRLLLLIALMEFLLKSSQPFLLRELIHSFSPEGQKIHSEGIVSQQWFYTGILIITTSLYSFSLHKFSMECNHLALKCKIACNSIIYRKLLRLSKTTQSENASMGKLVNLMGTDTNSFDFCFFTFNMLLIGPPIVIFFTYFLWLEFGPASLAGLLIIALVLIPFQVIVRKITGKLRTELSTRKDERGRIMNEVILGIRIIKMYAWQTPFTKLINKLRELEISPLRKGNHVKVAFQSLNLFGKTTIPFLTFIIYVSLGNSLTAEKAYFALSVYAIMIMAMAQKMPVAVALVGQLLVSIRRIQEFLLLEEVKEQGRQEDDLVRHENFSNGEYAQNENESGSVTFKNVSASWNHERTTLQNVTCHLNDAKLVMIIGPVGSGKSSLVNILISELQISHGELEIKGRLSYAAQDPWIYSGSIRQNILFGCSFDYTRYKNVLRASALEEDLIQWPNGDETLVGERGVQISGGQKARIGLARALYKKADVYLLDGCLSSVDSSVCNQIFQKGIQEFLKGSLRILVTHQLQFLNQADHVILLNNQGEIQVQGTPAKIASQNLEFLNKFIQTSDNKDVKSIGTNLQDKSSAKAQKKFSKSESQEETMQTGAVTLRTYVEYITGGNSRTEMVLVISLLLLNQAVASFSDKFLSIWTNNVSNFNASNATNGGPNYALIYSLTVIVSICLSVATTVLFFHYCISISIKLHDRIFHGVVHAPVLFFDRNPSGRILNRFTKDLSCVDERLPNFLQESITLFLITLGTAGVIITTNYYLVAPSIILFSLMWRIRTFFLKSSGALKRIESVTKSPIFNHLASSVQGLTTIRGLGAEKRLIDQFDLSQNVNTSAMYAVMATNRWLSACVDVFCTTFFVCVASSFIIFDNAGLSGNVGMALTLAVNMMSNTQWGMRVSAELDNLMTSMERVLEWTTIKPEEEFDFDSTKSQKQLQNWPKSGAIKFYDVSLCYDESKAPVLHNLNFEIKSKEKIGIVGRTGAGKSSIIAALFRMTEPQGDIFIDGESIKEMPLYDLRSKISIISQDPTLFSGTIRYNLDPFEEYSDKQIWEVIKEVNLKEVVSSLNVKVTDGGENYSVGQRQLLCLARAILRNNKIIVMDECTANIDPHTDEFIQRMIRVKFKDCTIITIAHRINTVMDSDRILVLEGGFLKEFDTPQNLLRNKNGCFTEMVNQSR